MVSNPYHFSRLGTTVSAQITDGTDKPHTGLIKALSVYSSGSYPVKTSSDFDITAASANTINITSGKVVRDGELQAAITAGSGLSIGDTSAGKTYSLVVVDSLNAFAVRTTTTDNAVPEMSNGDIPIALVLYTSIQSTTEFQYFTNRKESNSLSIGYSDSGTFTEAGSLTGDANGITMTGLHKLDTLPTATVDGTNSKVIIQDGDNSDTIRTVTAQSIANLNDITGKQDTLSGLSITALTVAPTSFDKVLIQDSDDSDNLRTTTTQNIANLYNETDTLDSVVSKGSSTTRAVTVGALTTDGTSITNTLTLSKILTLDADNTVIVNLADASTNNPANQFTLPSASINTGKVYFIKNMNAANDMNVVTAQVFDNNQAVDDPRYVNATTLILKPLESVLLQAFATASLPSPVNTVIDDSWLILDVNSVRGKMNGNLDVNGNNIVSASNGDITIAPHGTGEIVLDGLSWPTADGTANHVLQTDGSGQLSFVAQSGGGASPAIEDNSGTPVLATGITEAEIKTLLNLENSDIVAAVESESGSNTFTDADHLKLDGIETNATADQTGSEIKTAYEAEANAFTDAQFTKLSNIETGATADQTDAEIKTAYENNADTNPFTDAEQTKLSGIATSATATPVVEIMQFNKTGTSDISALKDTTATTGTISYNNTSNQRALIDIGSTNWVETTTAASHPSMQISNDYGIQFVQTGIYRIDTSFFFHSDNAFTAMALVEMRISTTAPVTTNAGWEPTGGGAIDIGYSRNDPYMSNATLSFDVGMSAIVNVATPKTVYLYAVCTTSNRKWRVRAHATNVLSNFTVTKIGDAQP